MEGVTDYPMRALLTSLGGIDECVSEFLRVSAHVPPARVFGRYIPESQTGWKTASGTPVVPQLLGGDPQKLAGAAEVLIGMGAPSIDLNFGCPAKTVNRHDGGASLLKCPDRIDGIIRAVRERCGGRVPVTAKIRLGWENPEDVFEIARRVQDAGADRLVVHARTKAMGYGGKAQWEFIRDLRHTLSVPLVANGDISTPEDFEACRQMTGCDTFMIGRGAVKDPYLFLRIRGTAFKKDLPGVLEQFIRLIGSDEKLLGFEGGRVKQFVKFLASADESMAAFFEYSKKCIKISEIASAIPEFFSLRNSPPNRSGVLQPA